jgi:hypothetical protein
MNTLVKLLGSILLSIACVGCVVIEPKLSDLAKSSRPEQLVLGQSISTVSTRGLNVRCEEGALAGVYESRNEDINGTYFFGKGRSIWAKNEKIWPTPRLLVGGIYVPKGPTVAPSFFYIMEKDVHSVDNVNQLVQDRIIQTASNSPVSGAQVGIGTNVVGNVMGGALVSGLIEMSYGRVSQFPPIQDTLLSKTIRESIYAAEIQQPMVP